MSAEQNLTDKNVVTTANATHSTSTKTNKKHENNNNNNSTSNKKFIKKALKLSKTKKHTNLTNVNNKNVYNKTNTSGSSNCGKNNVEVANDEIIEESFDFSDTDLKELGDIKSAQELISNTNFFTSDNTNNQNNEIEKNVLQEPQVGLKLLSSSVIDNMNKQNEDTVEDNELVMTTINNVISAEENVDKNMKEIVEPFMTENCEVNDLLSNKGDCKISAPISSSTFVSDSKADNNNTQFVTSPETKPEKTNNTLESSPLVGIQEGSNINTNDINDPSNDDNNYNDDDFAEPYDELLVQFLDEANQIAEARLAARRHARAEAREIRMRELERQQKEQESNADRVFDMHSAVTGITPLSHMRLGLGSSPVTGLLSSARGNSMSSRRSSEDSLEEEGRSLRDIRHELKDVEERFRKAMIANAQLDNDRASQTYQIQLLKDKLEDMEESYSQLQRECKEKTRDCNALKRSLDKLNEELKLVQGQLNERDTLITEQGLLIVAIENEDGTDAKRALVSVENAQLLGSVQGSLDVRLKKFSEEKHQLQSEVQLLQEQLETYKSQGKGRGKGNSSNGPLGSDDDDYEAQREANKIISDFKYKFQKAEQEIASLQSSLARSETQVIRYKSTAEAAEKAEAELKIERRKLQRENRETMEKLEELQTSNNHLLKRLDKLKNAKSALLKDL